MEIPTLGEGKQVCKGESEYPSLSVSDVYRWLESQGHFPRDSHPRHVNPKRRTQQKTTHLPTDGVTTADQDSVFSGPVGADRSYCRHCGLHYRFHPSLENSISGAPSPQTNVNPNASVVVKQEPIVPTMPTKSGIDSPGACMHFDKVGQVTFPMVDVRSMLDRTQIEGVKMEKETLSRHPSNDPSSTVNTNSSPLLVSLTDPKLVKAIHRLASTWRLPHFPLPLMLQPLPNTNFGSSSRSTTIPIEHRHQPDSQGELGSSELAALHTPKREFESQLGPSALLGLLLRPMAKLLLQTGVEIYQKDESAHELVQDNRLTPKVNINADPMTGQVKVRKRRGLEVVKKDDGNHRRVLTASHIVRGLLESGGADTDVRRATCILLSRMGLSRDDMGFE